MPIKKITILFFGLFLFISVILNIAIGAFSLSFNEIINSLLYPLDNELQYQVLLDIRVPRVIFSILVGMVFGLSGVLLQTLFKNPLADPSIIGISAGASAGVVIFMMLSSFLPAIFYKGIFSYFSLPVSAFIGAILTILLIYRLSMVYNKVAVTIMLLSGIAINALFGALIGLFSYVSTQEDLKSFTFWTMGSLVDAQWDMIMILLPLVILIYSVSLYQKNQLNLILLGEDEARNSGVNVEWLKKSIIIAVSLCMGVSIAFCGIIGFVGLVVPHISRILVGSNHQYLLPLSALLGGLILLWADTIARIIIQPAELPIGIITAIIGAPVFLMLLLKNKYEVMH